MNQHPSTEYSFLDLKSKKEHYDICKNSWSSGSCINLKEEE